MKRITLLLICLFLFSAIAMAQQKKYIPYTVKKGETVKSIAKTYHITSRDLLQLNPDMGRNIKPNTVIIVPNLDYGKQEVKVVNNAKKRYLVLPKDTLYGISKKYGITIEELLAANPQLVDGPKPGMELVIPEAGKSTEIDLVNYEFHTVVKDDTLYNLSKRYNVSQSELMRLNPELNGGLKLGTTIKIRPIQTGANEKIAISKKNEVIEKAEDKVAGYFNEKIDFSKEIELVIMLPYQLNTLTDSTKNESFRKNHSLLNIVTDFHLGATMAIDSLRKRGMNINAKFLDSENSNQKLQSLINKNNFKSVDVVIGPLYFDNAYWLSKHIDAPVIVPFYSKNQAAISSHNLVKAAPENDMLESELLSYLGQQYRGENIVVINDGKSDSQSKLWRVVNKLKLFRNVQDISVLKSQNGYISNGNISEKLSKTGNNWVLLVSEEMVTTASAINSLKALADNFKITLISLDKGNNFDSIDNNLLGKLNFIYPTTEFLNVDDPNVNNFYKTYQTQNYAIPSKYAQKGFDLTYDVLVRIATEGNLDLGFRAGKSSRVSTMFNYDKNLLGSFENKGIYIIQYNTALTPVVLN
ncbi:MAG: LysM peptidoglycan-binding domain-containing protein [Lutibacter sp.]|jgi:LysM repeat protein